PPSQAPDAMVVLGRPAGYRGSYQQWKEDNIAPQVVFEIVSPSNTFMEMADKQRFYQQYGVEEMYFYNPKAKNFWGFVDKNGVWEFISDLNLPWVSPLLKIRFELFEDGLDVFYPNGEAFKTLAELVTERDEANAKLERAIAKMKAAGLDFSDL
ncbi:MAG: Uma2 family endonuclease, partial [Spirulina sp. SIO3F2]|nr:Uma2 family endonuclease [Spirulina sp. SIO3F2]